MFNFSSLFLAGILWVYAASCKPTEHARGVGTKWKLASLRARDNATSTPEISGKQLRILPVGDSITQGFRSLDMNGYRFDLKTLLQAGNNSVDMVGLFTSGNMTNNQEQGIDGAMISNISAALSPALQFRPNVVLLHAGTNDMNNNFNITSAPARLSSLIDQIRTGCPDATVLIAKIIASRNTTTNARIGPYNEAVDQMVTNRTMAGEHVLVVDMQYALSPDMYNDTLHPNDEGYKIMAGLWYEGLSRAFQAGWIARPFDAGNSTSGRNMTTTNMGNATSTNTGNSTSIGNATTMGKPTNMENATNIGNLTNVGNIAGMSDAPNVENGTSGQIATTKKNAANSVIMNSK